MAAKLIACSTFGTAFGILLAGAQVTNPYPISTDRPSFSDGTSIVPVGHPQVELGFNRFFESGLANDTYGQTIFRFADRSNFEWRLSNGNFENNSGANRQSGWQDPTIGIKWLVQPGKYRPGNSRPEYSLELSSSFPIGSPNFRAQGLQPTAKFIWEYQTSPNTILGGNLVLEEIDSPVSFPQFSESIYIDQTLSKRLGAFAEVFRIDPLAYGTTGETLTDYGFEYLLNKKIQVDIEYETSISGSPAIKSFGFGIAYRY